MEHSRFSPYPPPPCSAKYYSDKLCCRDNRCQRNGWFLPPHSVDYILDSKNLSEEKRHKDWNNNIEVDRESPVKDGVDEMEKHSRRSPIHMLLRLFPQHSIPVLKNILSDCNNDPVYAIERILDKCPSDISKNELLLQMGRSTSPAEADTSKQNEKRQVGLNDDQLSSLARAYDIPVTVEKTSNRRKGFQW